ncbi:MAG: ParB/RepB/Spo0J family partition protein [Hyphomicrobiaceae bacterium]|nr:ParB/RepB/Spo0J family partition protein [Hyphomicrobiaceae bacterium]
MSDTPRNNPDAPIPLHKGRLGRGLASLIGGPQSQGDGRLPEHGEQRLMPIANLHPSGLNPRKDFDETELAELADSIRAKGLVQPIICRPDKRRGGFEIVAGERRWRAAQRACLHNVPVIVRDLSDLESLEFALIENVQRADLNPIEEAVGYNELIERHAYTQEHLSEVVGKSRSHVANTLRLLKLPRDVQALVREGKLSAGAARAIIGHKQVDVLAEEIVSRGLNVREVEALVTDMQHNPPPRGAGTGSSGASSPRQPTHKDPDTAAFEKDLSDALGLKVEVRRGPGETGFLTIQYGNYEQLDHIRNRLVGR